MSVIIDKLVNAAE
jgi:hypothetical protein